MHRLLCALTLVVTAACTATTHKMQVRELGSPLAMHDARDARVAVRDAKVMRTLVFDDGVLRIRPASDAHPRGEAKAIALARSSSPAGSTTDVSDVVVGYGLASLELEPTTKDQTLKPAKLPSFHNRAVWFIVHENGPHSCPALPPPTPGGNGTRQREPLPLLLIAADGSGEGVAYLGRGSYCGFPVDGPLARPAFYELSVPWRVVSSTPSTLSVAVELPSCSAVSTISGPGWPDTTVSVSAEVVMARGVCRGESDRPVVVQRARDGSTPKHAATGLLRGMMTGTNRFTYFDGSSHTIR